MTDVYVRYVKIDETTNQWQYATSNQETKFVGFGNDANALDVRVGRNETNVNIAGSDLVPSGGSLACKSSDITFASSALPIHENDELLKVTATCRTVAGSTGSGYVRVKKSS